MSAWNPIQEHQLLESIENSQWSMEGLAKRLWELIKLSKPEKWQQHPWGDEGNGFWVVAVMGNACIYYNDIEDGFNVSSFERWGEISEYFSNQLELHELIQSIAKSRFNS
jgi:hypothetical protein